MKQLSRTINDKHEPVDCLVFDLGDAALGDCIARLAAAQFTMRAHAGRIKRGVIFAPKFFVDLAVVLIDPELPLEACDRRDPSDGLNGATVVSIDERTFTTLHTHLSVHAALCYSDRIVDVNKLNYPIAPTPPVEIPGATAGATIITPGFTSPNRQMRAVQWNILIKRLKQRGHKVVVLGKTDGARPGQLDDGIDYTQCDLDLRNKTSLVQALYIMREARCVLGVDNGLMHLAACAGEDVPLVVGYTSLRPEDRLPTRRNKIGHACGIVVPDSSCRFCQSDTHLLYEQDYRLCAYQDYKCTKTLWPWKWHLAMEQLGVW